MRGTSSDFSRSENGGSWSSGSVRRIVREMFDATLAIIVHDGDHSDSGDAGVVYRRLYLQKHFEHDTKAV